MLSDHNNNLIHHLSFNKKEKLEEILAMPGVQKYYSKYEHCRPIFFNFFGQSQLDLAFEATDYETFQVLIDVLLLYQESITHSYLIN